MDFVEDDRGTSSHLCSYRELVDLDYVVPNTEPSLLTWLLEPEKLLVVALELTRCNARAALSLPADSCKGRACRIMQLHGASYQLERDQGSREMRECFRRSVTKWERAES